VSKPPAGQSIIDVEDRFAADLDVAEAGPGASGSNHRLHVGHQLDCDH
jgi:hypothetical protein